MHADPNELAKTAATDFVRRLVQDWQHALSSELLGAYLLGSLAHSGFSRRYSDIDVALVTESGLSEQTLSHLRSLAVTLSADLGPKVSIFWTDRHFALGRFLPLDRVDYLDHAIAVTERERVRPPRPTLEDIRHYLSGSPLSDWADRALSLAGAETLEPKDHKACLRAFLYPSRFCYSWLTGLIGSNDDAAAFLIERRIPGLDLNVIVRALECRRDAADPVALFRSRSVLPRQIDACVALVDGESHSTRLASDAER